LDFNNLSGTLPTEIGNLDSLQVLSLGNNSIESTLPAELYTLPILDRLYLFDNNLTGDLSQFGSMTSLTQLYVNGNQFSGTIPTDLTNLTSLQQLGLSNNQLEGELPAELSTLPLTSLFVDGNFSLAGEVSANFTTSQLNEFLINNTGICEPGLSTYQAWVNTLSLYQSSNISCPQNVTAGDSLALVAIYNTNGGDTWPVSNWLQEGIAVSEWEGISVLDGRVNQIDLAEFGVVGALPAELGNLDALVVLGLANNQVTSLPDEIAQLSNLRSLYIDGNEIEGAIPVALGSLITLEEIYAQRNRFTGSIPDALGNLENLYALWLSDNKLSGEVPTAITSLSNLQTFNLSGNQLTNLPDLTDLTSLSFLDVSRNYLPLTTISQYQGFAVYEYSGQKFRYTAQQTGEAIPGGSVTLSITDSDLPDNQLYWFKDGQNTGLVGGSITIENLSEEDAGLYECIVTLAPDPFEFGIPTNSIAIDLNETDRRYAAEVLSFTSQFSSPELAADQILGAPDRSIVIPAPELGYAEDEEDTQARVELTFANPAPINTAWIYGDNSLFRMEALNPETGVYDTLFVSPVSNGIEAEVNFPTTPYNVSQVRISVNASPFFDFDGDGFSDPRSIDALAIGDNGIEINVPTNLFAQVVTEDIINLNWSFANLNDSTSFVVARSSDGVAFEEIVTLTEGFNRYRDEQAPAGDTVYYQVKAVLASGLESEYSDVLIVEKCDTEIVGLKEGSYTVRTSGSGFEGTSVAQSFISINQDGSYTLSNVYGNYLQSFLSLGSIDGIITSDCNGNLSLEKAEIGANCGSGGQITESFAFTPSADSLSFVYKLTNCPDSILVSFVKDATEPIQPSPSNLIANLANESNVFLQWVDNSQFEDEWVIERSSDNGKTFAQIATITPNPQREEPFDTEYETYADNTVSLGETYIYQVRARNGSGDSEPSNQVQITASTTLFDQLLVGDIIDDQPTQSYSGTWIDVEGDGDLDLHVGNWIFGAEPALRTLENYLYLNDGNGNFTKETSSTLTTVGGEYSSRGAYSADFDNDGNVDFFVQGQGSTSFVDDARSYLFYGNGSGEWQVDDSFPSASLNHPIADFDNDGDLDIFGAGIFAFNRNNGDRTFTQIDYSGFINNNSIDEIANGWSNSSPDLNGDGLPDLYVDGGLAIQVWINSGDFNFELAYESDQQDLSRGSVFGDFDHDGDFDIIVSSRQGTSKLLSNDGSGSFTEILIDDFLFGMPEEADLQRGLTVLDYNNDGNEDLLWLIDSGQPSLFEGNGDGTFTVIPSSQVNFPLINGLSHPSVADYDNDGDQDIFISNFEATRSVGLFENISATGNHLRVDLEGTESNKLGIGSVIRVKSNEKWITKQVTTANGLWSSNELTAHFGLGTAGAADSVVVKWTSGVETVLLNVPANQTIQILELGIPEIAFDSVALSTEEFQPALFGTVSDTAASVEVELEGEFYSAVVNNSDSTWLIPALTIDSLLNGSYQVIARATNAVGVGVDTATLIVAI
ncbi:MAG: VCBS repeat-containing protein, partial [Ekhidna sp.]|nr:VCBS repeat-containing protein [Ekhidna sp.]